MSVGQSGDPNYLVVLNAILAEGSADRSSLAKYLQGRRSTDQLHVTKNYLYHLILADLRRANSRLTREAELHDLLRDVEILFRRDLPEQAERLIRKGLRIAERFEKFEIELELLGWHRRVLLTLGGARDFATALRAVAEREEFLLDQLRLVQRYRRMAVELAMFDPSADLAQRPGVATEPPPASLRAGILYYHVLFVEQIFGGSIEAGEDTLGALMRRLEDRPEWIADDPEPYVTAINNRIGLLLRSGSPEQVIELLQTIRSIPDRYPRRGRKALPVRTVMATYNVELELYRDMKDHPRGVALIAEVDDYLHKHKRSAPREYRLLFYYQFAYLCFLAGDSKESLRWLNAIITGSWGRNRPDIQGIARLLHLIIHYELGNIDLLKYAVESWRRVLKKQRKPVEYERVFLLFFSKLSTSRPSDRGKLLHKLRSDLFPESDDVVDPDVLDYLDFKTWIEDKISLRDA